MSRPDLARSLDDAHARLQRDGAIELQLRSLDELLDAAPESGADRIAELLVSARRLPDNLVVHVRAPDHADNGGSTEAAFRDYCGAQAEAAWRRVTTIRRAGMRQLAPSLLAAAIVAAVAVGCGTLAQSTGTHVTAALLAAVGGVCVIAAWVIVWMPIEELLFDWRPDRRIATAYALLARSRLEIIAGGEPVEAPAKRLGRSRPAVPIRDAARHFRGVHEISPDKEESHV